MHAKITAKQIAEKLEINIRTLYRYIDALCASGVPIISDAGHNGGYSLLNGCDPQTGFEAFQESVGVMDNPPLVTVLFVSAFARPGCMVGIDGIAVVESKQ